MNENNNEGALGKLTENCVDEALVAYFKVIFQHFPLRNR
jgi:hypothetical protein